MKKQVSKVGGTGIVKFAVGKQTDEKSLRRSLEKIGKIELLDKAISDVFKK